MQTQKVKRMIYPAISILLLSIEFVICRYLLFNLHELKQLPFVLFIFGLIVILCSTIFNSKKTMACTVLGYISSFFIGVIFQVDWIDSHGTAMNSLWIWFVFGMLAFVIIGSVWELIDKARK